MSQISRVPEDHGCYEHVVQGHPGFYAQLAVLGMLSLHNLLVHVRNRET